MMCGSSSTNPEAGLNAYDSDDRLPIGDWQVKSVADNPSFAFDPELFWDVPDSDDKQRLPTGPTNPVGMEWINLTKDHYGIHGAAGADGQREHKGGVPPLRLERQKFVIR